MFLNHAIVIGNLTRDPEVKSLPSGIKVTTFSVATNRVWKDKAGVKQESADYHNVVVFGRSAETAGQYLKKGQTAMVEGRMQTRSWDDASGVKKYRTEIVADRVQFGPKAVAGGGTGGGFAPQSGSGTTSSSAKGTPADDQKAPPLDAIEYPEEEINPDDIPF